MKTDMYMKHVCYILLWMATGASLTPVAGQKPQEERLRAANQRKLDYIFYEGINLKNAGKNDAAYQLFKHCLEIDSTSSAVLFELSNFYLQANHPEQAVACLKKAVTYQPDNFTYRLALAAILLNLDMYGEAADAYEALIQDYPDKIELNYYLAEAFAQQGEIDAAIRTFDLLETMIGKSEQISMQKFRLYTLLEETEKAFEELKRLAAKYPSDARYLILIGDLYLERQQTDEALAFYRKAYAVDPENPYYTVSMANYYESTGNPTAAEEQIRTALVNDKLEVEVKLTIISRYVRQLQQSRDGAQTVNTLFETLLEQHPEEVELKLIYGSLLAIQGNMDEARFQFQLAV